MASDPAWRRRYERAAAQQREADVPAMRAKYAGPFLPYLLEQLLIGLGFGLFGWLAVNWVWGLISFVAVAGVGPHPNALPPPLREDWTEPWDGFTGRIGELPRGSNGSRPGENPGVSALAFVDVPAGTSSSRTP